MSKRFEFINFLNAHDKFRDTENNKELDSFDIVGILNHYEEVLKDLDAKGAFTEVKYDYDEDEDGETVEQVIVDGNKYIDIEYFARIKADLEAKLAESEEKFIVANNLRKNSDEVLLNYKTEKYGLDKTIQELRKIKLSFPEKEWYYKGFENCERQMSRHIADLTLEVKQLKQQLAEKETDLSLARNEIDTLKHNLKVAQEHDNVMCEQYFEKCKNANQDKISFAINELRSVRKFADGRTYLAHYINNRVDELRKQLTHQHEDKGE